MKSVTQTTHFLWFLSALFAVGIFLVLIIPLEKVVVELPQGGESVVNISEMDGSDLNQSSFEEYEKAFSSREIFKSTVNFSADRMEAGGRGQGSAGVEDLLVGKYKVVGIIIDQKPEVIFEDVKTKETFFLSSGEKLDGAVIQEILPGKVILNAGGRLVTMTP